MSITNHLRFPSPVNNSKPDSRNSPRCQVVKRKKSRLTQSLMPRFIANFEGADATIGRVM